VDLQDGYEDKLQDAIERAVELGVVGCNLEDSKGVDGETVLISAEEHANRVKLAIKTAQNMGVEGVCYRDTDFLVRLVSEVCGHVFGLFDFRAPYGS